RRSSATTRSTFAKSRPEVFAVTSSVVLHGSSIRMATCRAATEVSMNRISIVLVAVAALAAGCSKKDGDKAAGDKAAGDKAAGDKAAGDKAADKAAGKSGGGGPVAVKLPTLGLALDAPGEVKVDKAMMGEGHMLTGTGVGAMQVETAKAAQTLDEAKE